MYGIFVNEKKHGVPYAIALVTGYKQAESRNKDMLSGLVGKRVAVIGTGDYDTPTIVGYVTISRKQFCSVEDFKRLYMYHLVPSGSEYDAKGRGKWLYWVEDPEVCRHRPLPASAVRHGRSWCEF